MKKYTYDSRVHEIRKIGERVLIVEFTRPLFRIKNKKAKIISLPDYKGKHLNKEI